MSSSKVQKTNQSSDAKGESSISSDDRIHDYLQEFLKSGARGVQITNIQAFLQSVVDDYQLPIIILEHRNKFYLLRKDMYERTSE